MEAPSKIQPARLADYFEVISRAVFQGGLPWRVIDTKWDRFREVFAGFDPECVAGFSPVDVDRLAADPGIVRNRAKIEATVANAEALLALDRTDGGFPAWLRTHGGFEPTVRKLRQSFRFLGATGTYYFLWVIDEPVPTYEDWCATQGLTPR